ncbi:hypothetical protein I7I48_05210 [Histoplasma ohiense]|nr:hypothetical protein I7I48_05210 [Histoplasma ohiense (nom. inval.)]
MFNHLVQLFCLAVGLQVECWAAKSDSATSSWCSLVTSSSDDGQEQSSCYECLILSELSIHWPSGLDLCSL